MNWLLIAVAVILIGYAFSGRQRGFIRTVFALFSTIIALMLTVWISPVISKQLQENNKVMGFVSERVEKAISFKDMGDKVSEQVEFINKLPMPKAIRNTLVENNTKDVYKAMAVDNFKEYISNSISRIIINAASFIVIMLIILIALALLCETLNIISKLPIINGLNKTAGLLAGLLQGIVVVWIGCIFLTVLGGTKLGQNIFEMINDSTFLSIIYNNNLLLNFIINLGDMLF
jgi:uncharacterized membrane protein required for colicin V production